MAASAVAAVLYAVVVGWNGSPSPDVPRLRFADDDAAEYARLLRDAGVRTTLLTDFDDDSRALQRDAHVDGPPTQAALYAALARIDGEMAKDAAPGELFIIYSGHGDVDHGEGYVMLDGGHLTRGDLYHRVLDGRRAARIHVVVDACKSYYLVYPRGSGGSRTRHDAPFVETDTPARFPQVGFTLSTSSATDSHEWEAYGGGVFSYEVRSALRGAADADGDGVISYAELGAFVQQANAAIPNPRFRPRFTVTAPASSPAKERTPVLSWPRLADAGDARRLFLDVPALGHVSVEDGLGRRLVDAHLADTAGTANTMATLHLPATATLYVWSDAGEHEYAVETPGRGDVALSTLAPHPRRVASRGALHEAFRHLFELPYGEPTVDAYLASPERFAVQRDEAAATTSRWSRFRPWKIATLTAFAAAALTGLASTSAALVLRHDAAGSTQEQLAATNHSIAVANGVAIGFDAAAGASAVTWAILMLLPKTTPPTTPPDPAPGHSPAAIFRAAPGPGQLGLSVAASW